MSEKEEMILILTDTDPIGLCDKAHAFQYDFCPFTGNGKKTCREACQLGIPRSEAVERIAKALWDRNQKRIARINKEFVITPWDTVERPSPNTQVYLENSEAALDALVEAKAPKS